MCTSIYLGALSALVEMARSLGHPEESKPYEELAQRCALYMDAQLFNGEYYEQKVQYKNLRDTSFADLVGRVDQDSSEMERLIKREGPKYQYGSGCLSDGVIGMWMARICDETTFHVPTRRCFTSAAFDCAHASLLNKHAINMKAIFRIGVNYTLPLQRWTGRGSVTNRVLRGAGKIKRTTGPSPPSFVQTCRSGLQNENLAVS